LNFYSLPFRRTSTVLSVFDPAFTADVEPDLIDRFKLSVPGWDLHPEDDDYLEIQETFDNVKKYIEVNGEG
jgi:hypothetical protein